VPHGTAHTLSVVFTSRDFLVEYFLQPVADPGFANGGARSSAEWSSAAGASIEAPKAPRGVGSGVCPLPRKFFDFESENGDF